MGQVPRVERRLSELCLNMLSEHPQARGSAAQLEQALEPVQGQARPDAKGRCPQKWQVALNGGCWAPVKGKHEVCEGIGGQVFKGTCYVPGTTAERPPTSHPMREP